MSLLTIIMPVYNAQETLSAALNGILNQTYKTLEILLVDDGSTDTVRQQLDQLRKQDKRVQIITQKHAGPGAARNAALQVASGNYVYFADADDVMEPDAARIMVQTMREQGTDLLTFGYRQINRKTGAVKEISAEEGHISGEQIRSDYTRWTSDSSYKVLGSCWNKCFRLDLIKEYGVMFPDLKRNEEEVFIMRYIEHVQDVYNIPNILYNFYPIGLKEAWKRLPDDFCQQVEAFRQERLGFAKRWNCDTSSTRAFIAWEYWGKMLLGLRLCFNPEKPQGYGEFRQRCCQLSKGLLATGEIPDKISQSVVYKMLKWKLYPGIWLWVRRSSKG